MNEEITPYLIEEDETKERKPFEINDISSLTWVMREILTPLKAKVEEVKALQQEEYDRITKWAEKESRTAINNIEYWEYRISEYHNSVLQENPKLKTLSTPYGKSKTTTSKAQPEKFDEDKLLAYAKENQLTDMINVKESIKWGDLKKTLEVVGDNVVDANGEIVEGAKAKPQTTTFKIEIV